MLLHLGFKIKLKAFKQNNDFKNVSIMIQKLHEFLNWYVSKHDLKKIEHIIKKSEHTSGKSANDSLQSNMFQKCRRAEIVK